MIRQYLILIIFCVLIVTVGGPFFTKAMGNAIDMQINMQLRQMEALHNDR